MIKVGTRSGHLDSVMEEISNDYEEIADTAIDNMIARFEPDHRGSAGSFCRSGTAFRYASSCRCAFSNLTEGMREDRKVQTGGIL